MALIGIAEAAKLVGRDRKSLYRAIKEGRLSATQSASGARQVDTSELIRVYGDLRDIGDSGATSTLLQVETSTETDKITRLALLEMENKLLRERLLEKDQHIEDMRNTVRLLEHKTVKKSWWPW